jgi:cardiolipin synthase
VDVYRNGREIFPALIGAIDAARHTVDFETYLYGDDPVADRFSRALGEAAQRGVRTRVILDGIGSWLARRRQSAALRRRGVEVRWFRPPGRWRVWTRGRLDNRTHRKILVVDGKAAFTGGAGIRREWEGDARTPDEWRDTFFRIEGPAAAGFRAAFLAHWARPHRSARARPGDPVELGPLAGSGDAEVMVVPSVPNERWSAAAKLFRLLPREARRTLRLTTPYFVPDDETVGALEQAARRGVAVEVLVPGRHTDHRICQIAGAPDLRRLHAAGVAIHRYGPTFIHTKTLTVDGAVSMVGTANLDRRSTRKDDEILAVVLDGSLTETLDRHFAEDASRSVPLATPDPADVSWGRRALEALVRPFRDQL